MSRAQRRRWEAAHGIVRELPKPAEPLVHLLSFGAALCGIAGTPGEWPEGHSWARLSNAGDATCKGCLDAYYRGAT